MMPLNDTIVAPATAPGGALAIIRVSGENALEICDSRFVSPSGKTLARQAGNTILYGNIVDSCGEFIDETLVSVFKAPASYTGENMVEISCHGSRWIVETILKAITEAGARLAGPGEFTVRAFMAGKMDLTQAEAVADMIASDNRASHSMASAQLRGAFSAELATIRSSLLHLASLLELELDFSEEDVSFADRTELALLLDKAITEMTKLSESFSLGNAIKEGIAVAIIGKPNAGKSTLLNRLLGEDRAMVSDIAGTTRDVIEEKIVISGIGFRFIDTAGIRESDDTLERMGIERTYRSIEKARIILYMIDGSDNIDANVLNYIRSLPVSAEQRIAILINKTDKTVTNTPLLSSSDMPVIKISAKFGDGMDELKTFLTSQIDTSELLEGHALVSNARHYEALHTATEALLAARAGIVSGLSSELLAEELRQGLDAIGTITGEICNDEILSQIFSKFCIGK